jgi:hypothetical protein
MKHILPLVWSGRLRAAIYRQASATAAATKGQVRGVISLGRLGVSNDPDAAGGAFVAPPLVVLRTLNELPATETTWLTTATAANLALLLDGATQVGKRRTLAPPGIQAPAGKGNAGGRVAAERLRRRPRDSRRSFVQARLNARAQAAAGRQTLRQQRVAERLAEAAA